MTRPAEGTPEWDLWIASIEVATAAPWKRGTDVHAASIPWTLILDLRAALEAVGIDWQTAKRKDEEWRKRRREGSS